MCISLSMACGGPDRRDVASDEGRDSFDITEAAPTVETGCLTASGDRFLLTALEPASVISATPSTELYQLIGAEEQLRAHVGREVVVTGDAEPAQVAEVRELGPPTAVGTSGSDAEVEPRVGAVTETRIETRHMQVHTVTPTGDEC
jgi:hypothetical protein